MDALRAVIVDDERPARRRLRELIERRTDVALVSECLNGAEAVRRIPAVGTDLLFLDVQMPGLDGFGVLEAIGAAEMPATIFVTAYDAYALKAFEASALDYLLKPFSDQRFDRCLTRVLSLVRSRQREELGARALQLLDRVRPESRRRCAAPLDCLVVREAGRGVVLRAADIDWIEAAGVYVHVHSAGKAWLHRVSLNELESRLDRRRFLRIHRSTIVNVQRLNAFQPCAHGDFLVSLHDGTELRISRTYRNAVEARLGQPL